MRDDMKEIKAIIQEFMFPKVLDGLRGHPEFPGITISQVRGFGKALREHGSEPIEDLSETTPKIKLEIVVPDELADVVVEIIRCRAHTGRPGDGKIFVSSVDEVIKIRTAERGDPAV